MNEHPNTDRCLNIGYVGPTFRRHAVGYLIEPILERHDRNRFRLFCYSDVSTTDEVTQRICAMDLTYRDTRRLSHGQLTEVIKQDRIDILVDLNAHTAGSRLPVFAQRAAPIQVNYLAYPFTSGLREMDYRVTDYLLDPVEAKRHGPEALVRLKHSFWLYRPDPNSPNPTEKPPACINGHITFANLNNTRKFNREVAEVWASIMKQVPSSRLVMLSDNAAAQASHFGNIFSGLGVDPSRCELVDSMPRATYLERFTHADLCLDPFPYGGHTTALDSLWMGVPVLTLSGDGSYTRGAASILPRVRLEELVVHSKSDYVVGAVRIANDLDHLAKLRHNLRERMQQSELCDEAGFVAEYEALLLAAWQRYCQGLQPSDIHLTDKVISEAGTPT